MAAKRLSDGGIVEKSIMNAGASTALQENVSLDDDIAADSSFTDDEQQHALNHFRHCAVSLKRLPDAAASLVTWCMEHGLYKCVCMLRASEKSDTVDSLQMPASADIISYSAQTSACAKNTENKKSAPIRTNHDHTFERMETTPTSTPPPINSEPFTPPPPPSLSPSTTLTSSTLPSAYISKPLADKRCTRTQTVYAKRRKLESGLKQIRESEFADHANDKQLQHTSPCTNLTKKDREESISIKPCRYKGDDTHHPPKLSLIDNCVDENEVATILAQVPAWPALSPIANPNLQSKSLLNPDLFRSCINNSIHEIVVRQQNNKNLCNMTRSDVLQWNYFRQQFHLNNIYVWDVRNDRNDVSLCVTLDRVAPMIPDAFSVTNVKAVLFTRLPLLAQLLLRGGLDSPISDQLALLVSPRANFWRIVSVFFSRVNYLSDDSVKVSASLTTDPMISTKINSLLKMLKQSSRLNHSVELKTPNGAEKIISRCTVDRPSPIITNIPMSSSRSANRWFLPLPEVGDFRWLMLKLGKDFSHIFIPSWRSVVSYQHLSAAASMSRDNGKTVKISAPNILPDVYVSAKAPHIAFFGPYAMDQSMDMQLLCDYNGQYIPMQDYEKIAKQTNISKTVGCWLLLTREKVQSANLAECMTNDGTNAVIDDDCIIIGTKNAQIGAVGDQSTNNMQMVTEASSIDENSLLSAPSVVTIGENRDPMVRFPLKVSVGKLDSICSQTLSTETSTPATITINAKEPEIFRASAAAVAAAKLLKETGNTCRKKQLINSRAHSNKTFDAEMSKAKPTPNLNKPIRSLLISTQPLTTNIASAITPTNNHAPVIKTIDDLDIDRSNNACNRLKVNPPVVSFSPPASLVYESLLRRSTNLAKIPSPPQPLQNTREQQLAQKQMLRRRNSVLMRPMRSMLEDDRDSVLQHPAMNTASNSKRSSSKSAHTIAQINANVPQKIHYTNHMPQATASTSSQISTSPASPFKPATAYAPQQNDYMNVKPLPTNSNASESSAAVATANTTSIVQHNGYPLIRSITIKTPSGMAMLKNSAEPSPSNNRSDRLTNNIYQNTTTSSQCPIISNVFSAAKPGRTCRAAAAGKRRSTVSVSDETRPLSVDEIAASIQRRLPSSLVVTASHQTPQQIQQKLKQQQEPLPLATLTKMPTPKKQSLLQQIQPQHMPSVNIADPLLDITLTVVPDKPEPPVDKILSLTDEVNDTATTGTNQSVPLLPQQPPVSVSGWMISNYGSALGRIQAQIGPMGVQLLLYDIGSGAHKWTESMPTSDMVNQRVRDHILQFVYAFQPATLKMLWRFVRGDRMSTAIATMQVHMPEQWPDSLVFIAEAGLIDLKCEFDVNASPMLEHLQVELNMLRLAFACHVDPIHLRNQSRQWILNAVSGPAAECSASIERIGDDNVCVCFVCEQLAQYLGLQPIRDNDSLMSIARIASNIRMNKAKLRDMKEAIRNGTPCLQIGSREVIEIDDDEDE